MGRERGVWFAGDHTAPYVGLGTVVGAYGVEDKLLGDLGGVWLKFVKRN
jgi:hypothetical protein